MEYYVNSENYKNKIYNRKLTIEYVKNGIVLPVVNGRGGVLDSKENYVEISHHDGEWFKVMGDYKYSNLKYIDEDVIYLGVFIRQWGHFLLDSLSRTWIFNNKKQIIRKKVVFINYFQGNIDGNYLEALKLLGVRKENIMIVEKPTRFKSIIVPEMCTDSDRGYTSEYPQIFKRMLSNSDINDIEVPDKIYLSRTKLKTAGKKEFGEEDLENNFRLNNYVIKYPEKLSLQEQIAYFQKAKSLACLNGSIPFGVVFARKDIELIILNKTSLPHMNLSELLDVSGVIPTYIDVYKEPVKDFPRFLGEGPFWVVFNKNIKTFFKNKNWNYEETDKSHIYKMNIYMKYIFICVKLTLKRILSNAKNKLL